MSTREDRRNARAAWPIRAMALADEPLTDDRDTSTAEERLALTWQLSLEQWSLSGQPLPTYARSEMPGRIIRPGTKR